MNAQRCRKKSSSSGSDTVNESNSNIKCQLMDRTVEKNLKRKGKSYGRKPKQDSRVLSKVKFKSILKSTKSKIFSKESTAVSASGNIDQKHSFVMRKEITTGKGLAVPVCEGEEIVCL